MPVVADYRKKFTFVQYMVIILVKYANKMV